MPPQEEILIGRIVDHEATPQELERFEHMADDRPPLWRTLARQQISTGLLADRVLEHLRHLGGSYGGIVGLVGCAGAGGLVGGRRSNA